MPRDMSQEAQEEWQKSQLVMTILVRLDLPTGPLGLHFGKGTIRYQGEDYLGVGQFGGIDDVSEGEKNGEKSVRMTLSGVKPQYLAYFEDHDITDREVKIFFVPIDRNNQVVGDGASTAIGTMNSPKVNLGVNATILIEVESLGARWNTPPGGRWNHQDQTRRHPDDYGLVDAEEMKKKGLPWGIPNA